MSDARGIEGNLGNIGDRGVVAVSLDLTPEELAANDAANHASIAFLNAQSALEVARKNLVAANDFVQAVSEKASAARIAKAAADRAAASNAAAQAAAADASAKALAAQAAEDQKAADTAAATLADKTAAVQHTVNGKAV